MFLLAKFNITFQHNKIMEKYCFLELPHPTKSDLKLHGIIILLDAGD